MGSKSVMRSLVSFSLLSLLSLVTGICPSLHAQSNVAEQYLLAAANQERVARGLTTLSWDSSLADAAGSHARVMAGHRDISHRFAEELDLAGRGSQSGARFSMIAENVAEAPTATDLHDAWMNSDGHRANLLDPKVTAVGIAVVMRDRQLYAVEDFATVTQTLSVEEQEAKVQNLLRRSGLNLLASAVDARPTCAVETGFSGARRPGFIMRYTAGALDRLPEELTRRLATRQYREAAVGACEYTESGGFAGYRLAILLYR